MTDAPTGVPEDDPLYPLLRERNLRIPMPDGVALAADLYIPDAPSQIPVVIE